MREIKFRIWQANQKEYLYPDTGYQGLLIDTSGQIHEDMGFGEFVQFDRGYTIQQYTGLKDKNGVEIYEGDIIDNHEEHHNKKVVNYDPHSCFFCLIDLDDWPDVMYNGEMFNQAGEGSNFSGRIEVVGNIFEGVDK